ncbi:MAG TPA: trypsin-like serine protease [Hydrogenophaga sp.]
MTVNRWKWLALVVVPLWLGACGGGSSKEAVDLDPAVLCHSVGAEPKVLNGASCGSYRTTPVVVLYAVGADRQVKLCSGTRISNNEVLTAAHCVSDQPKRVVAGVFKADSEVSGLDATAWVVHPDYVGTGRFAYDAAIVRFPDGLPNPIMGILDSAPVKKGQLVYFAGWGLPELERLAVGAATVSAAGAEFVQVKYNGEASTICAGDSGGPIYRLVGDRPGLVGITSNSETLDCGANNTSSFTNVQTPRVLEFIQANAPSAVHF